ncbi:MAG: hypothetical protein ACK5X8_04310, partial [Planctomyces sp.]
MLQLAPALLVVHRLPRLKLRLLQLTLLRQTLLQLTLLLQKAKSPLTLPRLPLLPKAKSPLTLLRLLTLRLLMHRRLNDRVLGSVQT